MGHATPSADGWMQPDKQRHKKGALAALALQHAMNKPQAGGHASRSMCGTWSVGRRRRVGAGVHRGSTAGQVEGQCVIGHQAAGLCRSGYKNPQKRIRAAAGCAGYTHTQPQTNNGGLQAACAAGRQAHAIRHTLEKNVSTSSPVLLPNKIRCCCCRGALQERAALDSLDDQHCSKANPAHRGRGRGAGSVAER